MSQNMRESERFFTRSSISVKRARVATWRGRVSETVPFVSLREKQHPRRHNHPISHRTTKDWKKMRAVHAVVVV